jgi:hypothetical protein
MLKEKAEMVIWLKDKKLKLAGSHGPTLQPVILQTSILGLDTNNNKKMGGISGESGLPWYVMTAHLLPIFFGRMTKTILAWLTLRS